MLGTVNSADTETEKIAVVRGDVGPGSWLTLRKVL